MTGVSTGLNPGRFFLRFLDRSQFTESFHFDTDTSLHECVHRLQAFSRKNITLELVEIASTRYRFEITMQQPGFRHSTIARGILWEDDDIRFVNGEVRSSGVLNLLLMLVAFCFILWLSQLFHPVAFSGLLLMAFAPAFIALHRAHSNRSQLIHLLYDTLDDMQRHHPD